MFDNRAKSVLVNAFQAVIIVNPFFLSDHPTLSASLTGRHIEPPFFVSVIANKIERFKNPLVHALGIAHTNYGDVGQFRATAIS